MSDSDIDGPPGGRRARIRDQQLQKQKEAAFESARAFLVDNWNGFLKVAWIGKKSWDSSAHPEIKEARVVLEGLNKVKKSLGVVEEPLLELFQALVDGKGKEEDRERLLQWMHSHFDGTLGPEGTFEEGTMPFSEMLKSAASWLETIADSYTDPENFDSLGVLEPEVEKEQQEGANAWCHKMHPFMRTLKKRARARGWMRVARTKRSAASSTSSGKRKRPIGRGEEGEVNSPSSKRPHQSPSASEASERPTIGSASMIGAETQNSAPLCSNEISRADEEASQGESEADKPIPLTELAKDADFLELPVIRRARAFVRRNFPKWLKEQEKYRTLYKMNSVEKRFAELISEELDRHIKKTDDESYSEGFRLLEEYFSALSAAELGGGSIFTDNATNPSSGTLAQPVHELFSGKDWTDKDAQREDAETFLNFVEGKSPRQTIDSGEVGIISEEVSVDDRKLAREAEIKILKVMAQQLKQLSKSEKENEKQASASRQHRLTSKLGSSRTTATLPATAEVSEEEGSSATASQATAPVLTMHTDIRTTSEPPGSSLLEHLDKMNAEIWEKLGYD